MSSLNCLFIVQGEGRGHMTQALALRSVLARAGHRVCSVLVGRNNRRTVPDFFMRKMKAPVDYVDSPNFVCDHHYRSIRPLATLLHAARRLPTFRRSLQRIDAYLRYHRPDVVVNFFEPLGGLYYALYRPAIPMVCIAHQYYFLHPAHRFPPGHALQREATLLFARLTALGATRLLALSLYPVPDAPGTPITVLPPLLRPDLLQHPRRPQEPFFLAYLLNSGYARDIIRWHQRHPEQVLHCFWDNRNAGHVERYDETLTFHRLDDEKFLALMARCRGLITTAGFETVSEAMYLGKPVLAVPVKKHFEQYCNSLDAEAAGAGLAASHFDIDRLVRFLPSYREPGPAFQQWVREGTARFTEAVERAARQAAFPAVNPLPELAIT
ncbi:MAG: glycosyltransferase family protein [Rhodothermales bacterium]